MSQTPLDTPGVVEAIRWGVIELSGPDAADFLNRLTTLNFKRWDASVTRLGAFLTGRSGVVALGYFQSHGQAFHFILPFEQVASALEHIEKFHFAENMEVHDRTSEWFVSGSWRLVPPPIAASSSWKDAFLSELTWTKCGAGELKQWQSATMKERRISEADFDELRTSSGMPWVGKEIDSTVLVLEAGLERAVDRNKGCYPGQEVVERIFTYGQVNKKLLPVTVTGKHAPEKLPLQFQFETRPFGRLVSRAGDFGLAFIHKQFWDYEGPCSEGEIEIRILRRGEN